MAADGTVQPTSEQKLRVSQFNAKVEMLNRNFIRQIQEWFKQCPHYDFSKSVKSYLTHIERLDAMYSGKPIEQATPGSETPTTSSSGRVIAKAKRRIDPEAKKDGLNKSVTTSTPSGAPPRLSLGGDMSIIKPNLDVTVTAPTPKATEPSVIGGTAGGGRKRAIRGGGPTGGAETVVFRGSDSSGVSSAASVAPLVTLPKPTPGFWSKQKKDDDENESSSKPIFTFGMNKASFTKEQDSNFLKVPPVTFGNGKPLTFGVNKDENSSGSESSSDQKDNENSGKKATLSFPSFGAKRDDDDQGKRPGFSFSTFGAKKDDDGSEKKSTLTFSSFASKQEGESSEKKATLSFPSFGSGKDEKKEDGSKPTLTFPSFGSSTTASSGVSLFSFGGLPKSSTDGEKGDAEEGEYVPPKVEIVETEEVGSTFSSKCSVFKLVDKQYTKLGVGMLHLKEIDGKKSVLVRAATAIGTVWVNALMNDAMKVAKTDEKGDKIRLSHPASEKEMVSHVIRFPSSKEAAKVIEEIETGSK